MSTLCNDCFLARTLRILRASYCVILLLFTVGPAYASPQQDSSQQTLALPSGEEITAEVFGHNDDLRILWIGSSSGIKPRHRQLAMALSVSGFEVWQVDLAEALFMPHGVETMRVIPGDFVANLITALSLNGQYRVLVISSAYGAIPTLRGIHAWQTSQPVHKTLIGAILYSPYLYTHVPQLGAEPTFIPEVQATNTPLYIFQAAKNGNRWYLPTILEALQKNAPVYVELMNNVTSMFYDEDDAPETLMMLQDMPHKVGRAISTLQRHDTPLTAIPLPETTTTTSGSGLDNILKPYRGIVQPTPFSLQDVTGKTVHLENYNGKVTLINFWASWCPPCVEEIPSLNRLKEKMHGKPFELISINYAETPEHIRQFMVEVDVDFPVLVDPDGKLAGQWKVIVFPSTFVIGPTGKIQYGVNAAILWDTPEVIRQLDQLLTIP